jgi:hypothetical protein
MKKINGHQGMFNLNSWTNPQMQERLKNKPLAYGEISGHAHVLTERLIY